MYRIGLTGGIASGKSTVARLLKEMGLPVIDLDAISREVVLLGTPGYREVVSAFGQAILAPTGEIDRKELGRIIFKEPTRRQELESILHPKILQEMSQRIKAYEEIGVQIVIVEVPLLIEVGMMNEFDQVWVVYVSQELQLERLLVRDDLTTEEALLRLQAQMPIDEKTQYADKIIVNTGSLDDLRTQLDILRRELLCED